MRRREGIAQLVAPVAVAGACLVSAPPAVADDAGLFAAYNARQATELAPANQVYKDAFAVLKRSDGRRGALGVIRANRGINRVLTAMEADLRAQIASSESGVRARRSALREVRGWRRANRYESRGWRAARRGRNPSRHMRRAGDEMYRAFKHGQRAVKHFAAVGLSSPDRAISQTP
jgi:hypothetical protein